MPDSATGPQLPAAMLRRKWRLTPLATVLALAGLLWQCAAEGGPTGGPQDTEGPRLVGVEPPSGTLNLAPGQDIAITFHELVDPVSIPGSVVFTPEVAFTTRVRGRRVLIRPEAGGFQPGRVYTLTLQRGIRDYRRNSIPRSYQLVFSTGGDIPTGRIQGQVAEFDPRRPVEVGLFQRSDSTGGFDLMQTVDLAADGSFSFGYLPDGVYRLAAVEGGLGDFPAAIHRRPYALPSADSLAVRGDTVAVALRRSPRLARPQVQSAEWVTPTYLAITFDLPFGEAPLPANLYPATNLSGGASQTGPAIYGYVVLNPGPDTTIIRLGQGYTQLGEPYLLEPLAVPTPELVDTLAPVLTVPEGRITLEQFAGGAEGRYGEARGRITFSEPVRLSPGLTARLIPRDPTGTGQDILDLPLQQENPLAVVVVIPEPERFEQAVIAGRVITDEAGNAMTDSLLTLTLVYAPPRATGSIRGTVADFTGRVVVEARDAATGERVAYTVTDSARYLLDSVPPGFYSLFGHEQVGAYAVPYYSGRWEPYHRAARFGYYPEVVEVRPRWEVDGIDINFRVGSFIFPPDESAVRRE